MAATKRKGPPEGFHTMTFYLDDETRAEFEAHVLGEVDAKGKPVHPSLAAAIRSAMEKEIARAKRRRQTASELEEARS